MLNGAAATECIRLNTTAGLTLRCSTGQGRSPERMDVIPVHPVVGTGVRRTVPVEGIGVQRLQQSRN